MLRLSPVLLIATAGAFVGLGALPGDHGPGGFVRQIHAVHASDPTSRASWDVPLIQHCGYWSHFDHRYEQSAWPMAGASTTEELAAFGKERRVLREEPAEGDIFLQYAPARGSFVHAGIVVAVLKSGRYDESTPYFDVATIEGDTDASGEIGGGVAMRVKRRLSPASGDRFLRWAELESFERVVRVATAMDTRRSA
jgi:hypothetical protein